MPERIDPVRRRRGGVDPIPPVHRKGPAADEPPPRDPGRPPPRRPRPPSPPPGDGHPHVDVRV